MDLLEKILKHAYETVPYYKKLFDENTIVVDNKYYFEKIPSLSKDTIIEDENLFISQKYKNEYYSGKLILKRTSGSTGKCIGVYWTNKDDILSNFEEWKYRNKWYGVSAKDKYVSFHTTLIRGNNYIENTKIMIEQGINISLNKTLLNNKNVYLYFEYIKNFKPVWMLTQPSVLYIMLTALSLNDKNNMEILNDMKYIELTGEYLQKGVLDYFKECLPDVKFGNMYGTTETGSIALECPFGNQHILDNAMVEALYGGDILLTSLKNTAMPFIRYKIGDMGKVIKSNCECGFEGYDIKIEAGRESDIIDLPNGNKILSSALINPIEEINSEYGNPIKQFHFTQDSLNSIKIYLSINNKYNNWRKSIESSLLEAIKKHISEDIDYTFEYDANELLNNKNKLKIFNRSF